MATRLPLPARPERPWPHDWHPYEQYQVVHISHMERLLDEGVVLRDALVFSEIVDRSAELVAVTLAGRLACLDDVAIRVDKKLDIRRGVGNRYEVRTRYYQYHAWVRQSQGRRRRDLIRYDNAHSEVLHVHLFDTDGREYACPDVAIDDMPTLDTFIRHAVSLATV